MKYQDIQVLDMKHTWHPCSQMKDYKKFKPLVIKRAYGSYIELDNGKKIIDAISSWWCKSLGHNHPVLKKMLINQIEKFEHVIFANTTHEVIARLSHRLSHLMDGLTKVFYAGDGSCAIEIAMKMSLHFRALIGECHRNKFMALKNGYHGETTGALSVSDIGLYRDPYKPILFNPILIEPLYVPDINNVQWNNANYHWEMTEKILDKHKNSVTAIIFEPILQGAGGMKLYSQDFLSKLANFAKIHNIHLIADEIMTGLGRTGEILACNHAKIQPDFICLSKGLTSGWTPFSAVITTEKLYQTFYDDYDKNKSFLHSHTYSGNALGASLALATLQVIKNENLCARANFLQNILRKNMTYISDTTNALQNIRGIGAVIAADLITPKFLPFPRLGYVLYQTAVKLGALLRPLGNTFYWMPPLNVSEKTLTELKDITLQAILKLLS